MPLIPPQHLRGGIGDRADRIAELRQRARRLRRREEQLLLILMVEEEEQAREQRRRRTCWVKPWVQRRSLLGHYDTLMQELIRESPGDFKSFMRMEPDVFNELVQRVSPRITKSSDGRPPLEPGLKMAITIRFLATGDSYHSLGFNFRVPHNTISLFVPQVNMSSMV